VESRQVREVKKLEAEGSRLMAEQKDDSSDRAGIALARWDARTRIVVRRLLSEDIIAEHQRDPRGHHSDTLKRVLDYLRRSNVLTPYVVICTKPFREWRVARLSGARGQPPLFVDEQAFQSEAEAIHALFLKRVDEVKQN
jgi:branched-chain amino acid transport system permease protein